MKGNYLYLLLAGAALWIFGNRSVSNILNQLQISFKAIRPDFPNVRFILIFNFYNPLPVSIQLNSILGTVMLNQTKIADFYNTETQEIKPGNNLIEINTAPVYSQIQNIINNIARANITTNYTLNSGPISFTSSAQLK